MKVVDEVVCVNDSSLTALHSSAWKINKTVAQVVELVRPVESKFLEDVEQNLEVVVLFRCNNIDHFVECPVVVAADGSSDILSDID